MYPSALNSSLQVFRQRSLRRCQPLFYPRILCLRHDLYVLEMFGHQEYRLWLAEPPDGMYTPRRGDSRFVWPRDDVAMEERDLRTNLAGGKSDRRLSKTMRC